MLTLTALIAAASLVVASVVGLGALGVTLAARGIDVRVSPLRLAPFPQRSTIYAADGSVLGGVYLDYDREAVPLSHVNHVTREAVLAIEDHRFYQRGPLDLRSMARALVVDLRAGAIVQGGSTIAQQLVKDTITGGDVSIERKIREAFDAIRLERTYSKDRVLQMYLNEIYLGNSVYGVAAAAEFYFGESARQLGLAQAALLAGMIASPARYDPILHPVHARMRRDYVLDRMLALGWIDDTRFRRAIAAPIRLSSRDRSTVAAGPTSYWEQLVIHEFLGDPWFGPTRADRRRALFQGGLHIYTTLDPALQTQAQTVLRERMGGPGMPQSALVSIDPTTGAIRAMAVGNWGFATHRYDLALDPGGGRSAGSAFKAFTLAAALEAGISPDTVYNGTSPKTIPDCGGGETWTVHNAEPGSGDYPLWLATADSVNAVFAQVIDQVGPERVAKVAHRMGITSPLVPVCPLTLGASAVSPLEMTSAYGTLANGGEHCTPYAIADVTSSKGRILEVTTPRCDRAIPSDVAAEETAMLQNVIAFGTGTAANIGRPEAGKTGTGNDYEDAWFVGYVPQLVTGVWVGYAEAEIPMPEVPGYGHGFGGVLAAPIWHDFMLFATLGLSPISFAPPPSPIAASPSPSPTPTASPTPSPATTSTPTPTPPVTPAPSPTVTPTPTPSTTPSG